MALRILILLLIFTQYANSQSDKPSSYLWEITHPDVSHTSYVFASIRVNHNDVFDFSDSIANALQKSDVYLTEVDFMEIDSSIVSDIIQDTESSDGEKGDFDISRLNFSDFYAIDGKPTYPDAYLGKVALELDIPLKSIFEFDEYEELYDGLNAQEITFNAQSNPQDLSEYVAAYKSKNLDYFLDLFEVSTIDPFKIAFRNDLYASEFDELHSKQSLFFTIGIGHLIDTNSIFNKLKVLGYSVRNVGQGKSTNELQELYNRFNKSNNWETVQGSYYAYTLKSPLNFITFLQDDVLEINVSYSTLDGLMYCSMVVPDPGISENEFYEKVSTSFLDTKELTNETFELNGRNIYRIETIASDTLAAMQFNFIKEDNHFIIMMLIGLSSEALNSKTIPYFIENAKIVVKEKKKWSLQKSELGNLQYYFPEDIAFIRTRTKMTEYHEYENATIIYKTYIDGSGEYLVQVVKNPTGLTIVDPYGAHEEYKNLVLNRFTNKLKEDSHEYKIDDNKLVSESMFSDSLGFHYYVKQITRGTIAYRALEKTKSTEKNILFFDSFDVLIPKEIQLEDFSYPEAGIRMKAFTSQYQSTSKSINSSLDAYAFSDSISGVTMTVEFDEYDSYSQYDMDQVDFDDYNSILDTTAFDTLYNYSYTKLADQCYSYDVETADTNSFLKNIERGFYCNNHFSSISIFSPLDYENTNLLDELIESIEIDINDELNQFSTKDKSDLILADLNSPDTSVFKAAREALSEHEGFDSSYVETMINLLNVELLDDNTQDFSAKYFIIAELHEFDEIEIEQALISEFIKTDNANVKQIILESMKLRDQDYSHENFLELIKTNAFDYILPENLFQNYVDSLELFEEYYSTIKEIALTTEYDKNALELVVYWLLQDTSDVLKNDSDWIESNIEKKVRDYLQESATDTLASIDGYLLDYMEKFGLNKYETTLIDEIITGEDVFGQYKLLTFTKYREQLDETHLLEKVMTNEYYHYWINLYYQDNQLNLDKEYSNVNIVTQAAMRQYVYENYGSYCEKCEMLETLAESFTKNGKYLFMRCLYEDELYYYGAVGPLQEDLSFSYNENESVYYSDLLNDEQKENVKAKFRDYFIGKQ